MPSYSTPLPGASRPQPDVLQTPQVPLNPPPGRQRPIRLQARGLSAVLPNGRVLYDHIDLHLHEGPCALIGANGVGKSTLLRQLAGHGVPGEACVHVDGGQVDGLTFWLAQSVGRLPGRLVDVLGFGARFDALQRLLDGRGDSDDAALVGDDWSLPARLRAALEAHGLAGMSLLADPAQLSGGQCQQLRLLGALLSDARVVLLDEPSTFLDAGVSAHWCEAFARRDGAVLVVSHDPAWLQAMPRLLELRPGGLLDVDGGLQAWRALRDTQRRQQQHDLEQARSARAQLQRDAVRERQRLDQRQAGGRRAHRDSNQSPLLLDHLKGKAERNDGRLRNGLAQRLQVGEDAVRAAFAAVDAAVAPAFVDASVVLPAGRRVLTFVNAHPCLAAPAQALDWQACGPVRIGLEGANGSGKTTLLRALRGETSLASGTVSAHVPVQSLDQHLADLPDTLTALDWLASRMQAASAQVDAMHAPATRLALLGLAGERARQPLATLSGGERMRVALAAAAWAQPAAPLLLLDEPASHLDFDSVDALVELLRGWPGALLVVSHDPALLARLGLEHRLRLQSGRLSLEHCGATA
ncbi:ATP-binding cassette domain-containing protein [Luteimonas sp. RIT-PG2_3]